MQDSKSVRSFDESSFFSDLDDDSEGTLLGNYIHRHPIGSGIIIAVLVALGIILAMAGINATSLPDVEQIKKDAYSRISVPTFEIGDWGFDDHLALTDVEVVSRSRLSSAPEGAELDVTFGASAYANADVIAHFTSESIEATKSTTLGYARQHDAWLAAGTEHDSTVAFLALKGVSEERVLARAHDILVLAEAAKNATTNTTAENSTSLAELYTNGEAVIRQERFDAESQTDTVVIRFSKKEGFASYECDVTALFAFHAVNGVWELSGLELSEGAATRSFTPIIGNWKGTFQSQSTSGTKCLGANNAELSISIRSYTSDTASTRIVALISGLAHYHPHPNQDEAEDKGDEVFTDVEVPLFLATSPSTLVRGDVVFEGSLPETTGGIVTVAIAFGSDSNPNLVRAVVRTQHTYDASLFGISFERQASWDDTYLLTQSN